MVEDLLKEYPNVLILRVRMPIVSDLTYPRNFITKIIKYDKVSTLCFGMWLVPGHSKQNDATCDFDSSAQMVDFVLQVIDIPNSMTVLPELLPYSIEMVSDVKLHSALLTPCSAVRDNW